MDVSVFRKVILKALSFKDHNSLFAHAWLRCLGVTVGSHCVFYGTPRAQRHPKSDIIIGNNAVINSSVSFYSSLLIGRAKLHALSETSKIIIGDDCGLNGVTIISRSRRIEIGRGTIIAGNCVIMDSDWHHLHPAENRWRGQGTADNVVDSDVRIGEYVWLGLNCIILKGVTIGRGSVIGAGSVVTRDIPPMAMAAGNPARVKRPIGEQDGTVATCG